MTAVWGAPWNLRLVVLDAETSVAPDNNHRFVSLGIAVCRDAGIKQRYEWLINPGCKLDAKTQTVHKLTDRHLADEPTFDEVLPEIRRILTAKSGETVVLAAHNAGFDVGWLRSEVARVQAPDLPDLPVLDTYTGILGLAGVPLSRPRLARLLDELGLENEKSHAALADATAAALAAIELLERADARGHTDLDALLAAAGGTTSAAIKRKRSKVSGPAVRKVAAPPIPPGHVATHDVELAAAPTAAQLSAWRTGLAECAALRCDGLGSRVAPEDRARGLLLEAIATTATAGDVAGTATLLGALAPMLGRLPGSIAEMRRHGPALTRLPGAGNQRGVALALHAWLAPKLDALGRCRSADPCPSCREAEPCPLDTWPTAIAASAIVPTEAAVTAFWNTTASGATTSKGSGRGYLAMRRSAPELADAALRVCLEFHRAKRDRVTAALLAEQVWRTARCSDPAITEVRVRTIASGGRQADLAAALRVCHAVLRTRAGSTDPAWASLETRTAQIAARARRRKSSATTNHGPRLLPRPPREARFLRAS